MLVGVKIEPAQVNTGHSPKAITVTAIFTDDLSGFHDAFIVFAPVLGTTQSSTAYFGHIWDTSVSEGLLSGVYSNTMTLPQYTAEDWWVVQQLSVADMAGNRKDYYESSIDGFPEQLREYRFFNGSGIPVQSTELAVFMPLLLAN